MSALFPLLQAQEAPASAEAEPVATTDDIMYLDDFVVTAVAEPGTTTKMKTSVSVSSLNLSNIELLAPRNSSEIFRNLPALRAEATAGDSNTNMTARGLPLSTGGSQYVQLQEDGVPVLQFGDIAFATADTFMRADRSLDFIEFVRGGSASTYATSAPGGVINMISKTGDVAGGSAGVTRGLDFGTTRMDFSYGGPATDNINYHVAGFYRTGEGSRRTGFNGANGGQLKLNLTRKFDAGHLRFFVKVLDDTSSTYMPMPTKVEGTAEDPKYKSFSSFDILRDTQYTPYLTRDVTLDSDGNRVSSDVTKGVQAKSISVGAELNFKLPGEWVLSDRVNYAANNGRFVAPFPAEVASAQSLAESIGGAGATLWYATGPNKGQQITSPATLRGNGLLTRIHMFNTSLNDMGNANNNLRLNKRFELGETRKINLGLGYYIAHQNIDQDWNWNSYLAEVGRDANLIDVRSAPAEGQPASTGALVTENGQIAYGVPAWGWFARRYDLKYDIDAPYVNLGYVSSSWSVDASVRRENGKVRGAKYDSTPTRAALDMNNDGVISAIESLGVQAINTTPSPIVRYSYGYTSYSTGVNYSLNDDTSFFARYSKGFAVRADRLVDAGNVLADGSLANKDSAFNTTKQAEIGAKYRTSKLLPGTLSLNATVFSAKTDEANSEAAVGGSPLIVRSYDSKGVELEGAYSLRGFELRGSVTWTDAEITGGNDPTVIGNRPRRQAALIYTLSPSYTIGRFSLGSSVVGTTKAYTQDNNVLAMPAYFYVNGFCNVVVAKGLSVSLNVNNLFNAVGISEAEEGTLPTNGIVRARGIPGRTTSVSVNYTF
ncbi:MAG TPA: TonB-dependent receptor [Opitutaceae bacterium]|nr:TonB-dependent receptor [Opitutaceae bacterium]